MFRIFLVMAILAWGTSYAQKPDLDDFDIHGRVGCPDSSDESDGVPCVLISQGKTVYVVKTMGYGKEEVIWHVEKKNKNITVTVIWAEDPLRPVKEL